MVSREEQERAIGKILQEAGVGDRNTLESMNPTEKEFFLKILAELAEDGNSEILETIWEVDYKERPVDIMTFMQDEYYLGNIYKENLFDGWIPHLKRIYESDKHFLNVIFTGAIGLGKSNIVTACMLYDLYNLLCLRHPQKYHGITASSPIVFALFNITLSLASSVGTSLWTDHVNDSPYFREICKVNPRKKNSLEFPNNINVISGSRFTHALGQNVFGAFLDEVNFGKDVKNGDDVKSQMLDNYNSLLRRMESRFKDTTGSVPGHMFLVSSKKTENDFLEIYIQENKNKPNVYIVDEPVYRIKTHYFDSATGTKIPRWSGDSFKVLIGDQRLDSKILKENEAYPEGYKVIDVPIEYYDAFDSDIDNSIRDIAGEAVAATSSLIKDRSSIRDSINHERISPFPVETIYLSFEDNEEQLIDYMDQDLFRSWIETCPSAPRAVHIDIGYSEDALGMAMGHFSGTKSISRTSIDLEHEEYIEPIINVDFMIRVKNIDGQKLPLEKITRFIYDIQRIFGIKIRFLSTDGFQSEYMRQKFSSKGMKTKTISVDKTAKAYLELRQIHAEGRLDFYEYDKYLTELFSLIYYAQKGKVDHREKNLDGSKGSKDVADAVAGLCQALYADEEFSKILQKPTTRQMSSMMQELNKEINKITNPYFNSVHDFMKDKEDIEDDEYLSDYI